LRDTLSVRRENGFFDMLDALKKRMFALRQPDAAK